MGRVVYWRIMEKAWTVETVELVYPPHRDFEMFEEMGGGIPDTVIRGIARGRMNDGRPFYHERWLTQEHVNLLGEERAREFVREWAEPPREPPSKRDAEPS